MFSLRLNQEMRFVRINTEILNLFGPQFCFLLIDVFRKEKTEKPGNGTFQQALTNKNRSDAETEELQSGTQYRFCCPLIP